MVIVSKHISWTGARREQLSNLVGGPNGQVNVTWLSDTEAYVQGEIAEIQKYKTSLLAQGITVTELGDGPPIPAPVAPLPIPSGTVLDSDIWRQATNEIREEDRQAILTRVNTRYDNLGGTREP